MATARRSVKALLSGFLNAVDVDYVALDLVQRFTTLPRLGYVEFHPIAL